MAEMTKVEIITRQSKLEDLKAALNEIGINGTLFAGNNE